MSGIKSVYLSGWNGKDSIRKASGAFIPAKLNMDNNDIIATFIRVGDIANFARNGIDVIVPSRLDAERIMRQMQEDREVVAFNQFIKEKKIKFEK